MSNIEIIIDIVIGSFVYEVIIKIFFLSIIKYFFTNDEIKELKQDRKSFKERIESKIDQKIS